MKKVVTIICLVFVGSLIFSCKKTSTPEPGPPVIAYKDFNIISETDAYFHFTFTDPDGDIGLKNSDTTGLFAFGSPYYYDFHMMIFKYDTVNQVYVADTFKYQGVEYGFFNYRIPFVDNKSKDKSLTGEVYVELNGFRPTTTVKKFKYQFYIYDRAHHKSNVVNTPEFYRP